MINGNEIVMVASLREQVANIIRKQILCGQLQPGSQIIERSISVSLNISTTPVKEAFRILESEGLLYTIPRKGSYISTIDRRHIEEIFYVSNALDGMITRFAIPKLTHEEIDSLKAALVIHRRCVEQGGHDLTEIQNQSDFFHGTIRKACHNQYLLKMQRNMESVNSALRQLHEQTTNRNASLKRNLIEHEAILGAVIKGDAALAEKLMVEHKKRVTDNALKSLGTAGNDGQRVG